MLTRVGFILTFSWLLIFGTIWFINGQSLWDLKLNELGDFLAGSMAPLAVLWFIIGYFQQGEELKQNTKALELQAKELANQVQETKELVRNTSRQVELDEIKYEQSIKEKEPKFMASIGGRSSGSSGVKTSIIIQNHGGKAVHLKVKGEGTNSISVSPNIAFPKEAQGEIRLQFQSPLKKPIKITFEYENFYNKKRRYIFDYDEKTNNDDLRKIFSEPQYIEM